MNTLTSLLSLLSSLTRTTYGYYSVVVVLDNGAGEVRLVYTSSATEAAKLAGRGAKKVISVEAK